MHRLVSSYPHPRKRSGDGQGMNDENRIVFFSRPLGKTG